MKLKPLLFGYTLIILSWLGMAYAMNMAYGYFIVVGLICCGLSTLFHDDNWVAQGLGHLMVREGLK